MILDTTRSHNNNYNTNHHPLRRRRRRHCDHRQSTNMQLLRNKKSSSTTYYVPIRKRTSLSPFIVTSLGLIIIEVITVLTNVNAAIALQTGIRSSHYLHLLRRRRIAIRSSLSSTSLFTLTPDVSSSQSSSSGMDDDEMVQAANSKQKVSIRRAPRVDSQLLRYVSTTSSVSVSQEVSLSSNSLSDGSGNGESVGARGNELVGSKASPFERLNLLIASTLMHAGADAEESKKAADSVEAHTLERFRRRQLRLYMKARDDSWSDFFQNEAKFALQMSEEQTNLLLDQDFVAAAGFRNERIENVLKQMFEHGLKGKDCAAILTHTPSLALSKDGNVDKGVSSAISLLCQGLGLRRYDARKVIRSCPGLLTSQGANSAAQIVDMLGSLGVSRSSLAREKSRLPYILSRQPGALFRLAAFLASDLIRLPTDRVGPVLRRRECKPLLDSVVPLEYVLKLQASKYGDNAMLSQVVRDQIDEKYRVMKYSAKMLRDVFGVEDMAKIVAAFPGVLLLEASSQISPVVNLLENEIGIPRKDVGKVLQAFPALLDSNIENMKDSFSFMQSIGVSQDDLPKIIRAFPSILLLDVKRDMEPVVAFLREIGVANMGRFVTRLPPVLGYSVEKELRPKWEYVHAIGFDNFDIVRFPAFFSYPLERVIRTRFEYLIARNIPIKAVGLDRAVRFGDADFLKFINPSNSNRMDDFNKFSKELRDSNRIRGSYERRRNKTYDKRLMSRNLKKASPSS